ncbi:MAG: metal-sensitive transcriptional regulator [Patescibacteria group bacterium]
MVDPKIKARALHRTKIIKGQLEGLIKAIEKESYCHSLLIQSLSIQRSLKSLDHLLLESHLKIHVVEQMQKKNEQEKAINELLSVYTLTTKT